MVQVDDLSREIAKQLALYTKEVEEEVRQAEDNVTKQAVKELKQNSPKRPGGGRYSKGWRRKKTGNGYVIHNATDYQLTHLLEKGHVVRNKYGTWGRAPAYPHIRPVEEKAIREFTELVEKAIKT